MANKKPETIAKEIKKSLNDQLINKGADIAAFKVQVDSYCNFYLLEVQARERLKKAPGDKDISHQLVTYSKQQLAILKQLGLSVDTVLKLKEKENSGALM